MIRRCRSRWFQPLLVIGLCAAILLGSALLWRPWDSPGPVHSLDVRLEEVAALSEQSAETTRVDSREADEDAGSLWVEVDEDVGARALVGTITGSDGYRRRSVVTIGPTSLFAYIDTPNGTYEFAIDLGLHRHGWLLPTSSMLAGWDFSEPDYFIDRSRAPKARSEFATWISLPTGMATASGM